MSQLVVLTDSRIVMAEQNSHDVVNQPLPGGDPSPSGVPASNTDKKPAGGDEGEIHTTTLSQTNLKVEQGDQKPNTLLPTENNDGGQDSEQALIVSILGADSGDQDLTRYRTLQSKGRGQSQQGHLR
jgi:hypothetical protein